MLTLKNKVPASWTIAAVRSRPVAVVSCRNDASVKASEPTKNVTPIAARGADAHCEANEATAKHTDPAAKSTAVHHSLRSAWRRIPGARGQSRMKAPTASFSRSTYGSPETSTSTSLTVAPVSAHGRRPG